MTTPRTVRSVIAACVGGLALTGAAAAVSAQGIPTVTPDGTLSNPAAPPAQPASPAAPAQPTVIVQKPDGTPMVVTPEGADPSDGRYYYGEAGDNTTTQNWDVKLHGPVPEHHVVRKGDTLWDISWLYFNNPWEWPKVWSYNPTITSPHWIYPGDLVRLYAQGEAPVIVKAPEDPDEPVDVVSPVSQRAYAVQLRQLAYVDRAKTKWAGTIAGSVDEKLMLSTGDQVYVDYPEGKPPEVGKRFAIYTVKRKVKHPDSGKEVGSYVRILGELRIVSVKADKRARAVIEESNDIIERGHRVGPIQRRYRGDLVQPTKSTRDRTGTVVAMLQNESLVGEGEIVFIDLGENQGVKVGNILHVIRRGDAYPDRGDNKVGQNDEGYPSRSIGQVMVVDVGKNASVTMVVSSRREFEVGDRVLLRKSE